jgi:hypothetical protein
MANRKKQKPMKRITVTVDPDDYAAFDEMARHSDVTASWLIRRSMREFLDRHAESGVVEVPLGQLGQVNLKAAR